MKKLSVVMLALVLCLCTIFGLTACGDDGVVEGTYKFVSMSGYNGDTYVEVKVGDTYQGYTFTEDYMTVEIKNDGTANLISIDGAATVTWRVDGNKIYLSYENWPQEQVMEKDGNKLVLVSGGTTYTLSK